MSIPKGTIGASDRATYAHQRPCYGTRDETPAFLQDEHKSERTIGALRDRQHAVSVDFIQGWITTRKVVGALLSLGEALFSLLTVGFGVNLQTIFSQMTHVLGVAH